MTPEQRKFISDLDQDGNISPEDLLTAAEPEDSPIHDLFEWDNATAGHKFRVDQARSVITRFRVEYVHHVREIRAPVYIRNPELPKRESGYVRLSLLKTREEAAAEALQREINAVAGLVARTRAVADGLGLQEMCEEKLSALLTPKVAVAV